MTQDRTKGALTAGACVFGALIGAAIITQASQDLDDDGLLEFVANERISASEINANMDALLARIDALSEEVAELRAKRITQDMVLNVGVDRDYQTIQEALAWLNDRTILQGATITILVNPGEYTYDSSIVVSHSQGQRIRIIGEVQVGEEPEGVTIAFAGVSGLQVKNGYHLGYFGGFTLRGDQSDHQAVEIEGGSSVTLERLNIENFGGIAIVANHGALVTGDRLTVSGGYHGIKASNGSMINAGRITVSDCSGHGVFASRNAFILVEHREVNNSVDHCDENGVLADSSSAIEAHYLQSSRNGNDGFRAMLGSHIRTHYSSSIDNQWSGYAASEASGIAAKGASAQGNKHVGFYAGFHSWINAWRTTSTGNGGEDEDYDEENPRPALYAGYTSGSGSTMYVPHSDVGNGNNGEYDFYCFSQSTMTIGGSLGRASPERELVDNGNCYMGQ